MVSQRRKKSEEAPQPAKPEVVLTPEEGAAEALTTLVWYLTYTQQQKQDRVDEFLKLVVSDTERALIGYAEDTLERLVALRVLRRELEATPLKIKQWSDAGDTSLTIVRKLHTHYLLECGMKARNHTNNGMRTYAELAEAEAYYDLSNVIHRESSRY